MATIADIQKTDWGKDLLNVSKPLASEKKAENLKEPRKTKQQREEEEQQKNFDEISALYRKAEVLDGHIKQFKKAMQDLNDLVLRHKSTEVNIDEARNMESEADTEAGYILKIFKKVNSHYETPIITISQTELIKECASVVAREADKAMSKKEQQLKEVLAELRK